MGVIMSVLVIAVNCEGNKPWAVPGEQCHNLVCLKMQSQPPCKTANQIYGHGMGYTNADKFPRWQAIAALDISTEILLFTFSIALVWGLQMHISHKLVIMVSFAARLPYVTLPLPNVNSIS
jgi:hypothetical protein